MDALSPFGGFYYFVLLLIADRVFFPMQACCAYFLATGPEIMLT